MDGEQQKCPYDPRSARSSPGEVSPGRLRKKYYVLITSPSIYGWGSPLLPIPPAKGASSLTMVVINLSSQGFQLLHYEHLYIIRPF